MIFVDWHGVLSEARFWTSIRDHPAVATSIDFDRALEAIFTTDVVDEWMRGHLTTREVVAQFLLVDDRRKNCDRFCELGGQAIVFDGSPQMWARIEALATT